MPAGAPPVLVVTRLDDVTADTVISELNRRAVPVARLDPGNFPGTVTMTAAFDAFGLSGVLRTATRNVDLARVRSVYWRRPSPYAAPEGIDGQEGRWCAEEARYGLGGIVGTLPGAHYVNHPWRNRDAEYKPAQLATAERCGLTVPPTVITNELDQARRLRRISRLIVDGLRPSSAAIARTDAFSRSRSAMWMRSSSRRYLVGEGSGSCSVRAGARRLFGSVRPFRHSRPVRS